MSRKIGFVFLSSNQLPLKAYSEINSVNYREKILLHSICLIHQVHQINDNLIKANYIKEYTKGVKIDTILKNDFGIRQSQIVDYNPIPKKYLKNKNTVVYAVIVKSPDKIVKSLQETGFKVVRDNILLSFKLDNLDIENPDIFCAILSYGKGKNYYKRKIKFVDNQTNTIYDISLSNIIESLCGLEELREETKCYI